MTTHWFANPLLFTWLLTNVIAWTAQIGILVVIGALAAVMLAPGRARLIFWQGLLAIALLLPAIEPWARPVVDVSTSVSVATASPIVATVSHQSSFSWKSEYVLFIMLAGAALRALWILLGFVRLRRHRLASRRLIEPPVPFENLGIRWYVSDTISGPVTFGWLRPSILLPARVCELPADLREAIACHELIHVRRGDWLFVLAEEAIRGLFWFHPAVWFALSQIQLAREQTVDSEVVGLMSNRERYLDALLAVAAQRLHPDVAPAPLFLKKRQLAVRVAAVLKETRMSKPRLIASFTTVCSAALIAARLAVWFFPLQSPIQSDAQSIPSRIAPTAVMDGAGIEVDPGGPLMHRTGVFRTPGVAATGTVVVDASLNSKGEVTDAHVLSGPDELRRAALQSVLQWHYSIDAGAAPTVRATIKFGEAPAPPAAKKLATQLPAATDTPMATLKSIEIRGATSAVEQKVRASLPVKEGDQVTNETMRGVLAAAKEVDEHFTGGWSITKDGATMQLTLGVGSSTVTAYRNGELALASITADGVEGSVVGPQGSPASQEMVERIRQTLQEMVARQGGPAAGVTGSVQNGIQGVTVAPRDAGSSPQLIRVGGNVQQNNLISKVAVVYPPLAKQARIQGVVHLTTTIGPDGAVENIQVISGHPLLVQSAMEAVKQWVYKPTLLNGNPVGVITQVDVNFTLAGDPQ
jgi:TonB family protein